MLNSMNKVYRQILQIVKHVLNDLRGNIAVAWIGLGAMGVKAFKVDGWKVLEHVGEGRWCNGQRVARCSRQADGCAKPRAPSAMPLSSRAPELLRHSCRCVNEATMTLTRDDSGGPMPNLTFDWRDLLDRLKNRLDLNEVQLAAQLGLSPSMLAQVRTSTRPLPGMARIRLLDKLGYALGRDAILPLLPESTHRAILVADNGRAQAHVAEAACKGFLENDVDGLPPSARTTFVDLLCRERKLNRRDLSRPLT